MMQEQTNVQAAAIRDLIRWRGVPTREEVVGADRRLTWQDGIYRFVRTVTPDGTVLDDRYANDPKETT